MEEGSVIPEEVKGAEKAIETEVASEDEDEYTKEDEIKDIKRAIVIKRVRISISLVLMVAAFSVVAYLYYKETHDRSEDLNVSLMIAAACALVGIVMSFHLIHLMLSKSHLKEELKSVKKFPSKVLVREITEEEKTAFSLEQLKHEDEYNSREITVVEEDGEDYNYAKAKFYEEELGVNSSKILGVSMLLFMSSGLALFLVTGNKAALGIPFLALSAVFIILLIGLMVSRRRLNDGLVEHMQRIEEDEENDEDEGDEEESES